MVLDSTVEMLGFLEAPPYWKRMLAASLVTADLEAMRCGDPEAKVTWFLPPVLSGVKVGFTERGVGKVWFMRVELDGEGPLQMSLVKLVLDRRTGGGQFVDETRSVSGLGLAPELPACLCRRLDDLYAIFRAMSLTSTVTGATVVTPSSNTSSRNVGGIVAAPSSSDSSTVSSAVDWGGAGTGSDVEAGVDDGIAGVARKRGRLGVERSAVATTKRVRRLGGGSGTSGGGFFYESESSVESGIAARSRSDSDPIGASGGPAGSTGVVPDSSVAEASGRYIDI